MVLGIFPLHFLIFAEKEGKSIDQKSLDEEVKKVMEQLNECIPTKRYFPKGKLFEK